MSKLFALEDIDGGVEGEELEASPEVGEVADAETDIVEDASDISETTGAVDDGLGASEDLEQVEDVVADSEEEGGLTPVAAEAIRIAVESICHRVGANPKTVYSLYATENFKSASSRKANTSIALEGIGSFLKDLWAKIKAALKNLWDKATAFFDKHLSSLGRVKKALESAKSKLSDSSGKIKGEAYLDEAPSSLATAFGSKDDVSVAVINKYIANHAALFNTVYRINDKSAKQAETAASTPEKSDEEKIKELINGANEKYELGTQPAPLVGGIYITYTITGDREEGTIEVDIDRETVDSSSDKAGLTVAGKSDVLSLINNTLKVINDTIKLRDKFYKANENCNKALNEMGKTIERLAVSTESISFALERNKNKNKNKNNNNNNNNNSNNADNSGSDNANESGIDIKVARKCLRIMYKIQSKLPTINQEIFVLNVKLAKAVLGYTAVCLKHYK